MPNLAPEAAAITARDPVAAAAVAARGRLDDAFAAQDIERVAALSASDLIVNTP